MCRWWISVHLAVRMPVYMAAVRAVLGQVKVVGWVVRGPTVALAAPDTALVAVIAGAEPVETAAVDWTVETAARSGSL